MRDPMTAAGPTPGLCVLIAVLNNTTGLRQSLASLRRDPARFDVLVVDDGSVEPLRAETLIVPGRRVEVIRLPHNHGLGTALNIGLRWTAERGYCYVGRLDAGDEIDKERFQKQLAVLADMPECVLVASDVLFTDTCGNPLWLHQTPTEDRSIRRSLLYGNCLIHPSVTMRVATVMEVGSYSGRASVTEDYDLFRRLSRAGTFISIAETLTKCRYYPDGISVRSLYRQRFQRLLVQARLFEPMNVHAYLGVIRSILAMMAPGRANEWRKMLLTGNQLPSYEDRASN